MRDAGRHDVERPAPFRRVIPGETMVPSLKRTAHPFAHPCPLITTNVNVDSLNYILNPPD